MVVLAGFMGLVASTQAARVQNAPDGAAAKAPPRPHIRLESEDDIAARRKLLLEHIWGDTDVPGRRATSIDKSAEFRWPGPQFQPTAEIWAISQVMLHGVATTASYVAHPARSGVARPCLMVLMQGHLPELNAGAPTVSVAERLFAGGCDLIVHAMPLLGGNAQPNIDSDTFGRLKLSGHNAFAFLETATFSPMMYFFEPVAAALNQVLADRNYRFIGMAGLSGGGWTTTVYAALDQRIRLAVAIAGSAPISFSHAQRHKLW